MNKAILIGNLTADPDIRTSTNGITVATFTVAINRPYVNQAGEREADFIRCVAFRRLAENIGRYLRKGSKVAVEGSIQTRSYDGQDGIRRYVTEVICNTVEFLDTRSAGSPSEYDYSQPYNEPYAYGQPQSTAPRNQGYDGNQQPQNQPSNQAEDDFFDSDIKIDISEDDLPF